MTYRVICTYHPDVAVFGKGGALRKGAWRVLACPRATSASAAVSKPVLVLSNLSPRLLVVSSPRRRQPNSWCSPRKILAEWLQARAEVRRSLAACRAWREPAYHAGLGGD